MPGKLWTMQELADHLRVPVGTIKHWRHTGYGPRSMKMGKHVRYRQADVEKWQEAIAA